MAGDDGPATTFGPPPTVVRKDLFPKSADQRDVERLARGRSGRLWEDPDFSPEVALHGDRADLKTRAQEMTPVSAWLRPEEFAPLGGGQRHSLVHGDAAAGDVIQGELGDCYLLGALSTVAASEVQGRSRILDLVMPLDGKSHENPTEWSDLGFLTFRFYVFGEWVQVSVDTRVPCGPDRKPLFAKCQDPQELWAIYMEKAYAKLHGSYLAIEGGNLTSALVDLTGGFAEEINLASPDAREEVASGQLWERLMHYQRLGYLMGCAVAVPGGETEERTPENLMQNHAYGLLRHYEQQRSEDGGPLRLVQVRNPWGQGEWEGRWKDRDAAWDSVAGRYAMEQLDYEFADDGTFFMAFEDYASHMNRIYICKVLDGRPPWTRSALEDSWSTQEGTAGGCFNFPSWRTNPQWLLVLDKPSHAHFVLLQPDARVAKGARSQDHTIGMYIMRGNDRFLRRVLVNSDEIDGDEVVDSTDFVLRREVSCNTVDEPGEQPLAPGVPYVLMPSSFKPSQDGRFRIVIYTDGKPKRLERIPPLAHQDVTGRWELARAGQPATAGGPPGQVGWKFNPQFLVHTTPSAGRAETRISVVLHRQDGAAADERGGAKGVKRKALASAKDSYADVDESFRTAAPPRTAIGVLVAHSPTAPGGHGAAEGGGQARDHPAGAGAELHDMRVLRVTKADVVDRTPYAAEPEVGCEFALKESGAFSFVVVPSTAEANQPGEFTLSVYSDAELRVTQVVDWQHLSVQGQWKGRSAGGCRNSKAWVANPMYSLVPRPDRRGGAVTVNAFLAQDVDSMHGGTVLQARVDAAAAAGATARPPAGIGFYVLRRAESLSLDCDVAQSGFYTAEEVGSTFRLGPPEGADEGAEPGEFLFVPMTYMKNVQGRFTAHFFHDGGLEVKPLRPADKEALTDHIYREYAAEVLQKGYARYKIRKLRISDNMTRAKALAVEWFSKPYRDSDEGYKDLNQAVNALEAAFIHLTADPSAHGQFFKRIRGRMEARGLKVADYDMCLPGPQGGDFH